MEIYYAPKVKYAINDELGNLKSVTEYALVPAVSVSDAESKTIKHFEALGASSIAVLSVAPSQVSTVIGVKDKDKKED